MKCKYCDYINPDSAEKCACCGNSLSEKETVTDDVPLDIDLLPEDNELLDLTDLYDVDPPKINEKISPKHKDKPKWARKRRIIVASVAVALSLAILLPCLLLLIKPTSKEEPMSSPPIPVYLPNEDKFRFLIGGTLVDGEIKGYEGKIDKSLIASDDNRISLFSHKYEKNGSSVVDYYLVTSDGICKIKRRSYSYITLLADKKTALLLTDQSKAFTVKLSNGKESELPYKMLYAKNYKEYSCLLYAGQHDDGTLSLNRLDTSTLRSETVCDRISYTYSFNELFDNAILYKEYGETKTQLYRVDMNEVIHTLDGEYPQVIYSRNKSAAVITLKKDGSAITYTCKANGDLPSYLGVGLEPVCVNDDGDLVYAKRASDEYLLHVRRLENDMTAITELAPYYTTPGPIFTQDGESVMYTSGKYFCICKKDGVPTRIEGVMTSAFFPQCIGDTVSSFVGMPLTNRNRTPNVIYFLNSSLTFERAPSAEYEPRFSDMNANNPGAFFYTANGKIYVIREGVGKAEEFATMNTEDVNVMYVTDGAQGVYWLSGSTLMYSNGTPDGTRVIAHNVINTDFSYNTLVYRTGTSSGSALWCYTKNGSDGKPILDGKVANVTLYEDCVYVTRRNNSDTPLYDVYSGKSLGKLKAVQKNTSASDIPR